MSNKKSDAGRPRSRPEANYIDGTVHLDLPTGIRDKGNLVGFEWTTHDLIKLLNRIPNYSPFTEAEGFFFSTSEADKIVKFIINECKFPEGKLTGKPFIPEPWQWAIYLNTYCWFSVENPDKRRYNEVFIYVPRKNGKTAAFGAIPALISLFVDKEPRSQNFCCAADSEQAALNFRHAAYMVENNKQMLNRLTNGRVRHGLKYMEHNNGCTLKVLSSIADTKHGLSPNYVGVDEVHAHANSELIDVMNTGTGARESPLTIYTTTADYDRPSVCNDIYARAKKICAGTQSDPHLLPVIYEAQVDDKWDDPKIWRKANPNLGVSVTEDYFKKEIARVKNNPKLLNRFLRLHLNVRTTTETAWIYPSVWNATNPKIAQKNRLPVAEIRSRMEDYTDWFAVTKTDRWNSEVIDIHLKEFDTYYTWFFDKVEALKDQSYYAAYDNAAVTDIASLCLYFPDTHDVLTFNWVPAESIEQRSVEESLPYQIWYDSGLINNTPTKTIDDKVVLQTMFGEDSTGVFDHFDSCNLIAFDNWQVNNISNRVREYGLDVRGYPQSFAGMNHPCKRLEQIVEQQRIQHGGHPVLSWMIGNTMVDQNHNDEIRPSRKNSSDKIDGIVSLIMAIGASMSDEDNIISDIPGLGPEE